MVRALFKEPLISDEATDNAIEFGFEDYSTLLSTIIRDPSLKTPFTIAIYGAWGSGKTSLMKTITKKLETKNPELVNVKSIWFSAWEFEKLPTPLWTIFLNRIIMELQEMLPDKKIQEQIKALGKGLVLLSSDVLLSRTIGVKTKDLEQIKEKVWRDIKSINCLREELSQHINKALANDPEKRKRLVIFIDDLDRCLVEQSVEIFESIKLFLNCENCVFVVGVDKEQIRKIFQTKFQTQDEKRGISYVEKFVQLEFDLPPKTPDEVKEFMLENASEALKENPDTIELISKFIEPNPRKIKRWLNSVLFLEKLFKLKQENITPAPSELDVPLASIWLFLKASFPHFSALIASKPSLLNNAIELAKKETEESKKIGEYVLEEQLVNVLSRLTPNYKEPQLRELIHLTRYTPVVGFSSESAPNMQYQIREIIIDLDNVISDFGLLVETAEKLKKSLPQEILLQSSNRMGELNKLLKEANRIEHDMGHSLEKSSQMSITDERNFKWRIEELRNRSASLKERISPLQKELIEIIKTDPLLYQNFIQTKTARAL